MREKKPGADLYRKKKVLLHYRNLREGWDLLKEKKLGDILFPRKNVDIKTGISSELKSVRL